jgi:hypothetical protein
MVTYFKVVFRYCCEETDVENRKLARIATNSAEIRNVYLPNTSLHSPALSTEPSVPLVQPAFSVNCVVHSVMISTT